MTDIAATFRQHEILLTGANGFLGKVLLAMLLDRYPGLKGLHVVIRPRKNLAAEARFDKEILQSPALRTVVESRGADFVRQKVRVWSAELGELDAAVEPAHIEAWRGRVSLIVHCAGLVEFFPPLDESLRANVDSTEQMVRLARRIGAKLLHVSTCYVAGKTEGLVEETQPILGFYPYRRGAADSSFDPAAELSSCRDRMQALNGANTAPDPASNRSRDIARRLADLGQTARAALGVGQHLHLHEIIGGTSRRLPGRGRLRYRATGDRRERLALSFSRLARGGPNRGSAGSDGLGRDESLARAEGYSTRSCPGRSGRRRDLDGRGPSAAW